MENEVSERTIYQLGRWELRWRMRSPREDIYLRIPNGTIEITLGSVSSGFIKIRSVQMVF